MLKVCLKLYAWSLDVWDYVCLLECVLMDKRTERTERTGEQLEQTGQENREKQREHGEQREQGEQENRKDYIWHFHDCLHGS